MMGLGVINPHHRRNGFFIHEHFAGLCPEEQYRPNPLLTNNFNSLLPKTGNGIECHPT
jgi:hypothetical protein